MPRDIQIKSNKDIFKKKKQKVKKVISHLCLRM